MKTLELNIDNFNTINIDIDFLETYLSEETELLVYGIGKKKTGYGRFEIYLDAKLNGEWMFITTSTTDTLSIDKAFSGETSEEESEGLQSLISQILSNNSNIL